MPKIIASPVKRWPGTVTLYDPLNFAQLFGWLDAYDQARKYTRPGTEPATFIITDQARYQSVLLTGVLPCVESHALDKLAPKLTVDNFPSTPVRQAIQLAQWINNEVAALITAADLGGEDELPNG